MPNRKHVFISHHHADDGEVTRLTSLLQRSGHDIRNSSIRARPANQGRLEQGLVSDRVIERLLRRKISWASTVVVLIGAQTHARRWVDWEIRKANEFGKRIVGIYVRGGTKADIPPALEDYSSSIVRWNTESIIAAIDGSRNSFEDPNGVPRMPVHAPATSRC